MGVNYYVEVDYCDNCGRSESIHIGKSSVGWKFNFNYNEGKFYTNIDELQMWLSNKTILDEYGDHITWENFWQLIQRKQNDRSHFEEYSHKPFSESFVRDGYEFTDCDFS